MTSMLYYSYSRKLSEIELVEIDQEVERNREFVAGLINKLPSNSKRKAKQLCQAFVFVFAICQPLIPCAAVMLPMPSSNIYKLANTEESKIFTTRNYPQIAAIPASKVDKIRLTSEQIKQFDSLALQLSSGSITMEKAILQLRGGDSYDWATLAFIIYMISLQQSESFGSLNLPHINPIGWCNGKYDHRNIQSSRMKQMCAASADENGVKTYQVESQIGKHNKLKKISMKIRKNPKLVKEFARLKEKLQQNNLKAGKGTKHLAGSKSIYYARGATEGARIYFQYSGDNIITIIGESNKALQKEVINFLLKNY